MREPSFFMRERLVLGAATKLIHDEKQQRHYQEGNDNADVEASFEDARNGVAAR